MFFFNTEDEDFSILLEALEGKRSNSFRLKSIQDFKGQDSLYRKTNYHCLLKLCETFSTGSVYS